MRRWLLFAMLLSSAVAAQTHVRQGAFSYSWDDVPAAERFELQLDLGAYVNVGLPPLTTGTRTLLGDPKLAGAHSAVVRACTVALGCSFDSNTVAFVVDVPAPAPVPGAPPNLRIVASIAPPIPPGPVESPNFAKVTAPGVGSIVDAKLVTWALGPKDPLVEGGVEFVILHGGTREGGAATYLCYFNHLVYAWSVGNWYQQTALNTFQLSPIVPTGC